MGRPLLRALNSMTLCDVKMCRPFNGFCLKGLILTNRTGQVLEMRHCFTLQLLEVFKLSGALSYFFLLRILNIIFVCIYSIIFPIAIVNIVFN
jgi:hypothetical protein